MALPRHQHRLFADHAFAIDMADQTRTIGDPPVPGLELDAFVRAVLDADVIDQNHLPASLDCRAEIDRDPDGDPVGRGGMLEKLLITPPSSAHRAAQGNGRNFPMRTRVVPVIGSIGRLLGKEGVSSSNHFCAFSGSLNDGLHPRNQFNRLHGGVARRA